MTVFVEEDICVKSSSLLFHSELRNQYRRGKQRIRVMSTMSLKFSCHLCLMKPTGLPAEVPSRHMEYRWYWAPWDLINCIIGGHWKRAVAHLDFNYSNWSHGPQPCLTQWNNEPHHVGPPKMDGSWWRVLTNVVHWRECQITSVFLSWKPHEQYEKAKIYDTDRWTPQIGRCPICYQRTVEK